MSQDKPATIVAMERLIDELRTSRERTGDCPLTDEELEILTDQIKPIARAVLEIDPEALRWNARQAAREEAEAYIAEKVASGKLVRLEGNRVIEADRFDPAVHTRA